MKLFHYHYFLFQAYKNRFHGHHRVWFLRGWYTASWWNKTEKDVNCTAEQIKLAAGSYLATETIIFSDVPDKPTVAGWVRISVF